MGANVDSVILYVRMWLHGFVVLPQTCLSIIEMCVHHISLGGGGGACGGLKYRPSLTPLEPS